MPSRLWLAVAFVLAFGASPARADNAGDVIPITLDQAKLIKLPAEATTVIVGNPTFADVAPLKNTNLINITGKGLGQTNFIALDAHGSVLLEKQIRVLPSTRTVLVLQNGASRTSYSCNPDCMPTVQLGDDNDYFNKTGTQITIRNGLAQGTNSAELTSSGK
jgi:Pilus formation protein N terminal region